MADTKRLTLLQSFFAFSLTVAAIIMVAIASVVYTRSDSVLDSALDTAVRMRTQSAATALGRTLDSDWQSLTFLSQSLPIENPAAIKSMMEGIQGDGSRIAWVGYAGMDGKVRVSSNDSLIGVDVQARPWFQQGLDGNYGGDLHPALLLAPDDPSRQFIDLARPVRGADGVVNGVVAFHINASWLQRYLTETAQGLTIDLFLISPTGSVSLASNGSGNELLDRDIARIARTGANVGTREVWEDGNTYFSTLVSDVTYGEVPNFGWRMVGRIDTQLVNPIVDKLIKGGLVLMVLSSGVAIVLSALYARVYLVPIARLSAAAHRIRNGSREYPPAARSTADAHAIASSLLDLQHAKAPHANQHQPPPGS